MRPCSLRDFIILMGLLGLAMSRMDNAALGQVMGAEAEMDRLEQYAHEAIANDDPEGAAMNMGKAALMASELAKQAQDAEQAKILRGAEQLYRAQEHAYRAWGLFERAGGTPPASSGVCGTVGQAERHIAKSVSILTGNISLGHASREWEERVTRLRGLATDWVATVTALQSDFQCS